MLIANNIIDRPVVLQVELSKNNTSPEGNVVFVKPVPPCITEAPEALQPAIDSLVTSTNLSHGSFVLGRNTVKVIRSDDLPVTSVTLVGNNTLTAG